MKIEIKITLLICFFSTHIFAQNTIFDPRQLQEGETAILGLSIPAGHFVNQDVSIKQGGIYPISRIEYDASNRRSFAYTKSPVIAIPLGESEPQIVLIRSKQETPAPRFEVQTLLSAYYNAENGYPKDTKNWEGITSKLNLKITGPQSFVHAISYDYDKNSKIRIHDITQVLATPTGTLAETSKIKLSNINSFLRIAIIHEHRVISYWAYSIMAESLPDEDPAAKEASYTTNAVKTVNASRSNFDSAISNSAGRNEQSLRQELQKLNRTYENILSAAAAEIKASNARTGTLINDARAKDMARSALVNGESIFSIDYLTYVKNKKALESQLAVAQKNSQEIKSGRQDIINSENTLTKTVSVISIPKVYEYLVK
jgi:hypothetical protein